MEIDNNLVENAIRPNALGKKNRLFWGDAEVGHRGAILYTVIESCRRRGIDPYAETAWQHKEHGIGRNKESAG